MYSILYVDDDEALLHLNKIYLEKTADFIVEIVSSAQQALEKIRTTSYDAILSDYQMPGMDGIELLKLVRSEYKNLPFLLFTGKGREEIVIEALNNGADFYIQKGPDLQGMIAELRHKLCSAIKKRRTEDALQRSEHQLMDIINFLPDATFVIDVQGKVIAWNHAMEKMTGIPREDILGRGGYAYALPFFGERKPMLIDVVMHDPYLNEMPYPDLQNEDTKISSAIYSPWINNGKGAHLLVSAGPLYDPAGRIIGAIETIRDITDIRAIQHHLDITLEKNRGLIKMLPLAIIEIDLSCNITFANSQAIELFGVPHDLSLPTIKIFDYIPPEEWQRMNMAVSDAFHGKRCTGTEYLLRKHDGSMFPAQVYGECILDPASREPIGYLGIIIDVTQKKRDALALTESQERLKLAVEAGNIGIWDVDIPTMKIHDISHWINRFLGHSLDNADIRIDTCMTLINPLDIPNIILAFREYVQGRTPVFECTFRSRRTDGTWKRVTIRGQVIERDDNGEPVRITGIVQAASEDHERHIVSVARTPERPVSAVQYNP